VPFAGLEQGNFLDRTNFEEFDQVFWNFATIRQEIEGASGGAIAARFMQLDQWVRNGNTLIMFNPMPVYSHHLGQKVNELEPLGKLNYQSAQGSRMEVCGPQAAGKALIDVIEDMSYSFLLEGDDFKPLVRVKAANKNSPPQYVAGYLHPGAGLVIFLPAVRGSAQAFQKIQLAIQNLVTALTRRRPDQLPVWVNAFRSEPERAASAAIDALEAEAARIKMEAAQHQTVLDEALELKQLIGGSGQGFANAAANALLELGFRVVEGHHPRADLVVSNGSRIAAVELKGVEGSIAEKHLRQVVAWKTEIDNILSIPPDERSKEQAEYATAIAELKTPVGELDCKGLLIVGTFRTTPLNLRSEPDLPDPVERRLGGVDVCVITGVQLFSLVLAGRQNPKLRPLFVEELMNTKGHLGRARDWKEFLST
jgi:hypothetical protein